MIMCAYTQDGNIKNKNSTKASDYPNRRPFMKLFDAWDYGSL